MMLLCAAGTLRDIIASLPATTRCDRCSTIGFVRREHVIHKGHSWVRFYCGRCNHTWEVADAPDSQRQVVDDDTDEPPDHSR